MALRLIACVLGLVLVGASGADAAARQRDRCNRAERRTVALTPLLRVYDADGFYSACLRATGQATELFENDGIYSSGVVRAVAGRFVAYEASHTPECKADCPPGVSGSTLTEVVDARTGRTRTLHEGYVGALLLRRSGSVAWVSGTRPQADLSLWRLTGARTVLDSGDITGVRAADGRLIWRNAGEHNAVAFA